MIAVNYSSMVHLLQERALHQPDQIAFTFLQDGETVTATLTYGELDQRSRAIAAHLQALNLTHQRALLLYPPGLEYLAAFFGCLYADVVAVPAYPPRNRRTLPRILAIAHDAQAAIALTSSTVLPKIRALLAQQTDHSELQWLATDTLDLQLAIQWRQPLIKPDTLAFLQYTSGSTGTPKGVMLSHGNLLHNAAVTYDLMGHSPQSTFVSWLPIYHDMGLIGGILQPLYGGFPCVLMPPTAFLQRPYCWLKAISDYRATTSGGPNFAYDLCVQKITAEQRATLDLSHWLVAFNGAEPIRAKTLQRFFQTFAECGFQPNTFYPCYGMAEATLMVSGGQHTNLPALKTVERSSLEQNQVVVTNALAITDLPVADETVHSENIQSLVGCGRSLSQQNIVIAHPETLTRCQEHEVGEIWVQGPSIGHGYWNRPEETAETFQAYLADTQAEPFLRTGDLGFLHNGELYVTGRLKDLIIIRGRNLYPQDLERTAEQSHPALRANSAAAFAVEVNAQEQLVLVQEVEFRQTPDVDEVSGAIRQAIAEVYEVQTYAIILIKAGTISKTSSGKIQRRACRSAFLSGTLEVLGERILTIPEQEPDEQEYLPQLTSEQVLALPAAERKDKLEKYLQRVIGRSLGIASNHRDFYINSYVSLSSFGLDSLKIFEVKNRVEADFGVELSLVDLFDECNINQLADRILNQLIQNSHQSVPAPNTTFEPFYSDLDEISLSLDLQANGLSLSSAQRRIWFIQRLDLDSATYHISVAIHWSNQVNYSALSASLNHLLQRHDSLRTCFPCQDGQPIQVVQPIEAMPLPVMDVEPDVLDATLTELAQKPFDLSQAPLWRTVLLRRKLPSNKYPDQPPDQPPADKQSDRSPYTLSLTWHHLIMDGWSVGVLLRELLTLYTALSSDTFSSDTFSSNSPVSLPTLPLQYPAFTLWQRQRQRAIESAQLEYWTQQLRGMPSALNLPTDYPRPAVQTFQGARQSHTLSQPLCAALKALSQREGVTLFMTLLAAFQTLLYRYSGQEDMGVGSPIASRNRAELEPLVGCFINTLVFRTDLSGNPRFCEVLQQVRRVALEAYAHADLPFETLVETLQPTRDLSYSPLVQVMFALQNFPIPRAADFPELSVQFQEIATHTAKFDLTLFIEPIEEKNENGKGNSEKLLATVEYNTDLFKADTITRMLGHFQTLLQGIVTNPKQPLSELPLLTPEEYQDLVNRWSQTALVPLPYPCLHECFEAQVEKTPDAIAVQMPGVGASPAVRLTYRELNERANQLAHYLQQQGVQPDGLVGVHLRRSPHLVIALLGILKAGGAYVPLDPTYPVDRLAFMLKDSQAQILLTETSSTPIATPPSCQIIDLNTAWEAIAELNKTNPTSGTTADHLAYVIYTSGSTGKPKGTLICHRGLVNYLNWCTRAYEVALGEGAAVHSSISFDMTITGLFAPLLVGRRVELVPEGFAVDTLAATLRQHQGFSLIKITPAQLELLGQQMHPEEAERCTRAFIIGGENLSWQSLAFWQTAAPNTVLVNEYGPTETVVGCCVYPVPSEAPASGWVPIGKPIANTRLYILDRHLQPVPVGVAGELYIGGFGVARGYLNRPDLTAERFIPNPFTQSGDRLYQTGDLARWLPDGTIECLGRIDHQVKIRGFRVELSEVEAALNQHPAIQESVVMMREMGGEKRLVAYVIPAVSGNFVSSNSVALPTTDRIPTTNQLRSFLSQTLPDYMLPAAFVHLGAFPLTVNGKVDRQALPIPDIVRPTLSVAYQSPGSELEKTIAQIWQAVLTLEQVGIHDNFFDLGGHSLLLIQVHHHLQQQINSSISIIDLFKYPTISTLANYLTTLTHSSSSQSRRQSLSSSSQSASLQQIRYRARKQSSVLSQKRRMKKEQ
jgi:amino acid adenylation domain-containing protein